MQDLKTLYAGIGSAKLNERGTPLGPVFIRDADGKLTGEYRDGLYKIRIDRMMHKETRKGPAFIVEGIVVESNSNDHPIGERRTWFQKMGGTSADVGPGAVKGFTLAALQIPSTDEAKVAAASSGLSEVIARALGPEQALKGQLVDVRVSQTLTKEQKTFSLHQFSPGNPKTA